ncbi:Galactosylgalactosylxylosylprotein 3-beta-glucuronosyltransferase 2 [Takifugu flavidus]|uniref:Galactosylgalactosylxylosylprotein 3-beta-glucuronosyltransferase n=1 Tax=Takifugu flavidus TaxID=433684 RepID=A0A5C6PJH3_9TELE|nr:Galactosylgalactosylxylosylprotein 3-beta-glucuronosyltransferase 2 [Takifugu flavidus]
MRSTRGVSVWPVGFVGGRSYERPLVSEGKVVGWYTGWRPDRPFATDMAVVNIMSEMNSAKCRRVNLVKQHFVPTSLPASRVNALTSSGTPTLLITGFAVNLQVILANPRAQFKRRGSQPGMQESDFLKQITKVTDLEPKANNCTQVLVWHTRTEKPHLANEPKHRKDTVVIEV